MIKINITDFGKLLHLTTSTKLLKIKISVRISSGTAKQELRTGKKQEQQEIMPHKGKTKEKIKYAHYLTFGQNSFSKLIVTFKFAEMGTNNIIPKAQCNKAQQSFQPVKAQRKMCNFIFSTVEAQSNFCNELFD